MTNDMTCDTLKYVCLGSTRPNHLPSYNILNAETSYVLLQTYTIEWKRAAFFKFAGVFHESKYLQEMKAKVGASIHGGSSNSILVNQAC